MWEVVLLTAGHRDRDRQAEQVSLGEWREDGCYSLGHQDSSFGSWTDTLSHQLREQICPLLLFSNTRCSESSLTFAPAVEKGGKKRGLAIPECCNCGSMESSLQNPLVTEVCCQSYLLSMPPTASSSLFPSYAAGGMGQRGPAYLCEI